MSAEALPVLCQDISVTKGGRIYVCNEPVHEPGKHYFTLEKP